MPFKGLKECRIEPHYSLTFIQYDFAASKTTGHDVGDATENKSDKAQILVNQLINAQKNQNLRQILIPRH
ncbi:hypothetical protein TNCV_1082801 [Trichonephila clavipes]|nr:hypothetical protein TNCV_1082801 [Trichonephila clavipes]